MFRPPAWFRHPQQELAAGSDLRYKALWAAIAFAVPAVVSLVYASALNSSGGQLIGIIRGDKGIPGLGGYSLLLHEFQASSPLQFSSARVDPISEA